MEKQTKKDESKMELIYPRPKFDKHKDKHNKEVRDAIISNPRRKKKDDTPILAAEVKQIDAANLPNTKMSPDAMSILRPPAVSLASVMYQRSQCKFMELMLTNVSQDQIHACLKVIRNCLISSGVLPIKTKDETDTQTVEAVFEMLPTYPQVFFRAFVIHVILICPHFCKYMITDFHVNEQAMDTFANSADSAVTVRQAEYFMGIIRKSSTFVTLAVAQWQEWYPRPLEEAADDDE